MNDLSHRPPVRRGYVDGTWGQVHYRVAQSPQGGRSATPVVCLHLTPKSGWIFEPLLACCATFWR
jgi:hypothetical protein